MASHEVGQDVSNFQGPSASENSGIAPQIAESQGSTSQLRVEVTVLRAQNIPHIKNQFGLKNKLYVTVSNRAMTKKTASVSIEGQTVQWNREIDAFFVQPSSHIMLRLYAKRLTHPDKLIGTLKVSIPGEFKSQSDVPFVLSDDDGQAGQSTQQIMLYLTITVEAWQRHHREKTKVKAASFMGGYRSLIEQGVIM